MNKRFKKRHIIKGNFLSDIIVNDIMKGRDYSQPVDSEEAFKYRRNDDDLRRNIYNKLRRAGIPSQDAQRFKDWKPHHVKDIVRHKEMDDYGLSPEWILNPERKQQKLMEMRETYAKAGINKEPDAPLTPQETQKINNVLRAEGKPVLEMPTEMDYNVRQVQQNADRRNQSR
jgi:hypothetical protein